MSRKTMVLILFHPAILSVLAVLELALVPVVSGDWGAPRTLTCPRLPTRFPEDPRNTSGLESTVGAWSDTTGLAGLAELSVLGHRRWRFSSSPT
jgi:hypothetical protein